MRYFGRLYDSSAENSIELQDFQAMLDRTYRNDTNGFDIRMRMKDLTPKCRDQLIKCEWEGRLVDCADIFETRLTSEGFCCLFNNVRPTRTLSDSV